MRGLPDEGLVALAIEVVLDVSPGHLHSHHRRASRPSTQAPTCRLRIRVRARVRLRVRVRPRLRLRLRVKPGPSAQAPLPAGTTTCRLRVHGRSFGHLLSCRLLCPAEYGAMGVTRISSIRRP